MKNRLEEKHAHTHPFLPESEGIHNALVFRKLLEMWLRKILEMWLGIMERFRTPKSNLAMLVSHFF